VSAASNKHQYVDANGRRLAYRSIGAGTRLVLCTRFRGNMDLWDSLFVDSLAATGFRVITFDYSVSNSRRERRTTIRGRWRVMLMT
jgi:hypothetical protein